MPKILFLTAYPIEDASCRYRVRQFLPYLREAGYECVVSEFCTPQLFTALKSRGKYGTKVAEMLRCSAQRLRQLNELARFDAVVIHREAFPFFAPAVENWVLRHHKNVVFSFDDAIYAGHAEVGQLSHPLLYRLKHGRGYDEVMRRSSHVIAGNRVLAEYARKLNPKVTIVPTVVDCNQYKFRAPVRDHMRPLTIGWMGGRSTAPYLKVVEPALRRLAEVHGERIRFLFVGCPQYRPNLARYSSLRFELARELDYLHSIDIGLMPLPDTEWTRGKCAFKAIQYMAAGCATVASPVGITPDLIHNGVNGLLASSGDDWFQALNSLVCDADLRIQLTSAARKTIESGYSLQAWGPRFVNVFDQLCGKPEIMQTADMAA